MKTKSQQRPPAMSKLEMEKPIITLGTNPSGSRWWWVLLMILLWTPTWFLAGGRGFGLELAFDFGCPMFVP
jgi:hypothetical protein